MTKRIGLWAIVLGLIAAGLFGAGHFLRSPAEPDFFHDKTPGSGLDFVHKNGEEAGLFTILESLGGGVGLIDYDQDGLIDVFVTGGGHFGPNKEILGHPNRLFRNEGNWRFRDVTAEAGLPENGLFYSHGCAVGDFDNDGWPDLLVTGYGRMALFQNKKGRFTEITEAAGLADTNLAGKRPLHWSTSAAWADLTGDGLLDLFVCHYLDWSFANDPPCSGVVPERPRDVCPPEKFQPLPPALFINQGNGSFREAGPDAGLIPGHGLGVVAFDADNDGKLDVYVANDGTGNFLYLNQGSGVREQGAGINAKFREAGKERGVAASMHGRANGSMGIALGDYNGSGRPSLLVTNFQDQDHTLYRNLGNGMFQSAELAAGLVALGRDHVGFGAGFVDLDLDGSEDLVITHGHVLRYPRAPSTAKQRPALFKNLHQPGATGHTRFDIVTTRGGPYFRAEHMGRGLALGDLDNDGAVDLVISHTNEPATLLRNQTPGRGHWLGIELVGKPFRDAIGAKLTLDVDGRTLTRFVLGGGSYLSSSDRRVVFGLRNATEAGKLTVHWPSGRTQEWTGKDLMIGRYTKLAEGEPRPILALLPDL